MFQGKIEGEVLEAAIEKSTQENQGSWVLGIDAATARKCECRKLVRPWVCARRPCCSDRKE